MDKLEKIKSITGYSLEEIRQMNDKEFFSKITGLLAKGVISYHQYNWLDKQRKENGLDETTLKALDIFGGKVIK